MLGEGRQVDDNETRSRLLAAASSEFARHGFASARVRHIAEVAEANVAAVNYYFGGKDGLYRATLAHLARQARASGAIPNRRGSRPEERLHRVVYGLLDRLLAADGLGALGRILAHESVHPTAHFERVLEEALRPEVDRLHAVVDRLATGCLTASEQAQVVLGILGQCLLHRFAGSAVERLYPGLPRGADLCRLAARHITDMTLAGLERLKSRHEGPGA